MTNVATFKTTRNQSTALIAVDNMPPKEAFRLHVAVKERGRGAVKQFVENETVYDNYRAYHYQLKKLGVMPLSKRGKNSAVSVKQTQSVADPRIQQLEAQIKQLELQLQTVTVTPAQRALDVLSAGLGEINYRSRVFLAQLIAKDYASISHKQEKWLSDLESKHL
jgi:hypothetical protein